LSLKKKKKIAKKLGTLIDEEKETLK